MRPCVTYLSVSGLPHLVECPRGPSVLWQMTKFLDFLLARRRIIFHVCVFLSIYYYPYTYLPLICLSSLSPFLSYLLYSSISGHVGCFHTLAIVTNATMDIECRYLFKILSSSPLLNTLALHCQLCRSDDTVFAYRSVLVMLSYDG